MGWWTRSWFKCHGARYLPINQKKGILNQEHLNVGTKPIIRTNSHFSNKDEESSISNLAMLNSSLKDKPMNIRVKDVTATWAIIQSKREQTITYKHGKRKICFL